MTEFNEEREPTILFDQDNPAETPSPEDIRMQQFIDTELKPGETVDDWLERAERETNTYIGGMVGLLTGANVLLGMKGLANIELGAPLELTIIAGGAAIGTAVGRLRN